ncbi:MAG: hypothetical protein CSA29_01475 [Desulfobacterales bacterium]|nr:MAG: hypothetical protein CSA29_01475 [Desulfobacterales bacterium]
MKLNFFKTLTLLAILFITATFPSHAAGPNGLSSGQTVYVPAYSHIYSGNKEVQSLLAVTLSIRNTDLNYPIEILSVSYYDTKGNLLKHYLPKPISLPPLGSTRYIVSQNDKSGGSGANFIVKWQSASPVNIPIIETIMIGSRSSFTSRSQEIIPSK